MDQRSDQVLCNQQFRHRYQSQASFLCADDREPRIHDHFVRNWTGTQVRARARNMAPQKSRELVYGNRRNRTNDSRDRRLGAAIRWLEKSSKRLPGYHRDVVVSCLQFCAGALRSWEEDDFRKDFCENVVSRSGRIAISIGHERLRTHQMPWRDFPSVKHPGIVRQSQLQHRKR